MANLRRLVATALALALAGSFLNHRVFAASLNCDARPSAVLLGGGQVRVFAMHHRQDLADNATYDSIRAALDCELAAEVDPYRATDHPNLVVFNELNGLAYGTEGTRGAAARAGRNGATFLDQLVGQAGAAGIGTVAGAYAAPLAFYQARFGPTASADAAVGRLFTAITDTMVRAVVENVGALARKHHTYIAFGAPLPVLEGSACTGAFAGRPACPGWHGSTSPADVAALADPDLLPLPTCAGVATSPCVYVADTAAIDNVELFFAPDGDLYDMQPKVSLTSLELSPLGWHQASPATIHAIGFKGEDARRHAAVRMGVAISLDAFETSRGVAHPCSQARGGNGQFTYFMSCLDSLGVNVVLQPEFNDGSAMCMSWTDYTEECGGAHASWQPLSWMRSAWFAVQGQAGMACALVPAGQATSGCTPIYAFDNFEYAVNPFLVGNLFDIAGDGQTAIFSRHDRRATAGWYAGDSSAQLYTGAGVGVYTDRADDPRYASLDGPRPGFLALTPWVIREDEPAAKYRARSSTGAPLSAGSANRLAPGDPNSLQSCEKGLAPGSGVTSGRCAENAYVGTALVADLFPAAPVSPAPPELPGTGTGGPAPATGMGAPATATLVTVGLPAAVAFLRRRRGYSPGSPRRPRR